MGTDISTILEVKDGLVWRRVSYTETDKADIDFPLGWRFGDMFSFLSAGMNWKSGCPTILDSDRGLPKDSEYLNAPGRETWFATTRKDEIREDSNNFCFSWLTLAELLAFDYERSPGPLVEARPRLPDFTMRSFLGDSFFEHLERMKHYGEPENVRLIFWFS